MALRLQLSCATSIKRAGNGHQTAQETRVGIELELGCGLWEANIISKTSGVFPTFARGPMTIIELAWTADDDSSVQTMQDDCADSAQLIRKNVLRTREAACYLGISPWKLRELVRRGKVRVLAGKYWRFRLEDLEAFLQGSLL